MIRKLVTRIFRKENKWKRGLQEPNEPFCLCAGVKLRAVDEMIITLPTAILGENEPIGSVIKCDDDAKINMPQNDNNFYVWLKPGMEISLTKSCEVMIASEDKKPRLMDVFVPEELKK